MTVIEGPPVITVAEELLAPGLCLVPPAHLRAAEDNLRRRMSADTDEWKIFVDSIRSSGVIVPLIVTPERIIVAGHRRQAAALQAKRDLVPVVVQAFTDIERQIAMVVENLLRVDIDPLEEATGYFRCCELGLTAKDLATKVGRTQKHVAERLALLELPDKVQARISNRSLSLAEAADLARLVKSGYKGDVATITGFQAKDKLADAERKKKVAREVAALVKKGTVAVASVKKSWCSYRGFGWSPEQRQTHASLPCHVVQVQMNTWDTKPHTVGYCNDPGPHFDGTSSLAADTEVYCWNAETQTVEYKSVSRGGRVDYELESKVRKARDAARQEALDRLFHSVVTVAVQQNMLTAVLLTLIKNDTESAFYLERLGQPLPPHEVDEDDRPTDSAEAIFDDALRAWVTAKPSRVLALAAAHVMFDDRCCDADQARDVILKNYAGLDLEAAEEQVRNPGSTVDKAAEETEEVEEEEAQG